MAGPPSRDIDHFSTVTVLSPTSTTSTYTSGSSGSGIVGGSPPLSGRLVALTDYTAWVTAHVGDSAGGGDLGGGDLPQDVEEHGRALAHLFCCTLLVALVFLIIIIWIVIHPTTHD
jgi:hypothetical protein